MTIVSIPAAGRHSSQLVDQAASGEEIVITHAGKPVARLIKLAPSRRILGQLKGLLTISDDFDAPLPDDVIALFEGE